MWIGEQKKEQESKKIKLNQTTTCEYLIFKIILLYYIQKNERDES